MILRPGELDGTNWAPQNDLLGRPGWILQQLDFLKHEPARCKSRMQGWGRRVNAIGGARAASAEPTLFEDTCYFERCGRSMETFLREGDQKITCSF
eukprot:5759795-Pyramimonas_sp.AAC.2